MADIHPTAIIAAGAQLDEGVSVGAYSIIGAQVRIGAGTVVMPHVFIDGNTTIGRNCTIYPFASLGTRTQDLKYKGGNPGVIIGDNNVLREYVTVNAATFDGDFTRIGNGCLIMAYAHIAHDCVVGNEVIIANCGTLAGHIVIEDQVVLGGLSGIHQFVRIGRMVIIGGCSKVTQDIPPFMMADGHPLEVRGLNLVGMKRRGISPAAEKEVKQAFRLLYRSELSTSQAVERIKSEVGGQFSEVEQILAFIAKSERGISK